ncbi:transcriptional regulator, AraC family with amidase-like domain [Dyadobacter koreensis]|uniref:Transcriptional regulator, AraC family with amidase-like domain n=1 Tax=Dyadobacter koreensis TaxID=408657 RepID=A0A1H6YM29_9BACT|nr:GlxA family transcriptional regulator [Dyadobacter koreensis]SEJ39997.1 transcriptional regulator, AraC family with amidase-like domain [Dyadobacter koreensis]
MDSLPHTKLVVIVAFPNLPLLEVAGPGDVFFHASKAIFEKTGVEDTYHVIVIAADGTDQILTRSGITIATPVKIDDINQPIDTMLIAGYNFENSMIESSDFYNWLADISAKVRRIGSICVGTFALAKAGLLSGKNVTTHWDKAARLHRDFPDVHVDSSQFFIKDGNIYTSGGVSSATDLSLALVEEDYGREIAVTVARHLVLYLKRPGYQYQFGDLLPVNEYEQGVLSKIQEWMVTNLHRDLSVEQLAAHSNMSPRNFARVFLKETGLTPAKFVEKLRVEMARKLLVESDLSIEQIAEKTGLVSMVSMRRIFLRNLMVTPSHYRRAFKTTLNEVELT